ncbi:hypothetical protein C900_00034 [Fulvivirga imtechensis AK7]|uniref:Integral membrane protein n=1 Tax=Fulvivirga imtechensis AK7 TaxID=1237149 RepID=L8JYK3_9BACT|nr:stage II sporulation protein M [Fulvivirga imtechensis]ELR73870.1 hypothetical protein C900_00034 [Fulvivirga imtechensis AK7]
MKETKFIEQNKEKWLKFEQLLRLNKRDPDKLSDLFIQITDDLSYARTNYPNRSIRVYLNNLAQQLFYNIYKNKKESRNKFTHFWKEELPSIVFHSRVELFIALAVFLLAAAIGVVSSVHDPEFARSILGDSYVEMTIRNIEEGDPMGVYKKMNEVDMFLGITLNNVLVAFRTFITGIFFSLGAIIILIYNGIMVGTFQYFFIERDLGFESFLTIWLHGTLEISSIVIAGGAGIVLGKGFVFPGTYSRLRAFQLSARRGLKLLVGIVPILVFAALIESFITRYTELPTSVKLALILVSLVFMLFYFVWYPFVKHRNGTLQGILESHLQVRKTQIPQFKGAIRGVNEIFRDALIIYKKLFRYYIKPVFLCSVIYVGAAAYILQKPVSIGLISIDVWAFEKLSFLINYTEFPSLFLLNTALLAGVAYWTLYKASDIMMFELNKKRLLWGIVTSAILFNIPFFADGFLSFILWLAVLPTVYYSLFIYLQAKRSFISAMGFFKGFLVQSSGRILGLYSLLLFIAFVFFVLVDSPFFAFYLDFLTSNFVLDPDTTYYVGLVLNGLVITISITLILPLFLYGFSLQYFSLLEIKEAGWLKQQIELFGKDTE